MGGRSDPEMVSAAKKLYRLMPAEKIVAALKGSAAERSILIRDPNRMVVAAVLGNPNLTVAEIESFAAMKQVSARALGTIAANKDWTTNYGVVANLVKNPHTPVGTAMSLISRLNAKDMKAVAMNDSSVRRPPVGRSEIA